MHLLAIMHITPMFAASIEGMIVLLIIAAASALFNKLKKNNDQSPGDTSSAPPTIPRRLPRGYVPPPAQPKELDWEEELRRLLQGEAGPTGRMPAPMPQQRRESPRVPPVASAPSPAAEPAVAVPPIFQQEAQYKAHCVNCGSHLEFPASGVGQVITCPVCHKLTVLRPFQDTPVETLSHTKELSSLTESTNRWQHATQIDDRVTQEMANAVNRAPDLTRVEDFKVHSEEIAKVVALLRTPRTARQAILASIVLAPPKAFES